MIHIGSNKKKIWTTTKNRNRLTDTENKLVVLRGRGAGRADEISEGDSQVQTARYKVNKSPEYNVHIGSIVNSMVTAMCGNKE